MAVSTGPSIRAVCRIINQNSCGSGSVVGRQNGKSLILTNAHVAGTRIGRIVQAEHEQTGDRLAARVIMAAYSDRTTADWAVLETVDSWQKVEPVFCSKRPPNGTESHYTKGFPRCRAHNGTDITTVSFRPPVWFWEPDAIGGQSGSGVWNDVTGFQQGLLTWQWGGHGAGQLLSEIYKQARSRTNAGYPRPPGLVELGDFDFTGIDRSDCSDPIVENGFFAEASIADLPIWAEDQAPPPPPDDRPDAFTAGNFIEFCRDAAEFFEAQKDQYEKQLNGDTDEPTEPTQPPFTGGPWS